MDARNRARARPRTQPLARSLMLRMSAMVALCLLVLGGAFQFLVVRPAINTLLDGELGRAMAQVEGALRDDFNDVSALLATARAWGRAGRLDYDDVDGFNGLLMPLLEHNAEISSVLLAAASGDELLLLHTADGWHNRITRRQEVGRTNLRQTRDREGMLVREERVESDYDPRTRPWFRGAMALSEDGAQHLTAAYRFYTTGDPGITLSTRWRSPDGEERVLAFDVLLADLSRLTIALPIGEVGGAAVITADDEVLGLPRAALFSSPEAVRSHVVSPVAEVPVDYLQAGHRRWAELGRPVDTSFSFELRGEDWIGLFERLSPAGRTLWIGGFARSSDFVPGRMTDLALFGLLIVAVGAIGALMALRLARRIGEPLEALEAQSERIGRLELDPGPRVHAPWTEIERLADSQERMRAQLQAASRELSLVQDGTITALAQLAETRDGETGRHLRRTQAYVRCLAEALRSHPRFRDALGPEAIEMLVKSAPLHDIGKVGVPDRVLLKPGRLEPDEFELMQTHTTLGRDAIEHAEKSMGATVPFLQVAKEVAYSHQEKWDGSGYPQGLSGDQIPISARLMAVADVYDALISRRIYKPPHSHRDAVAFIRDASGTHFDPDVVQAFLAHEAEFREIAASNLDPPADLETQRRHLERVFGEAMPAANHVGAGAQAPSRR